MCIFFRKSYPGSERGIGCNIPSRVGSSNDTGSISCERSDADPDIISRCRNSIPGETGEIGPIRDNRGWAIVEILIVAMIFTYFIYGPIFFNEQMDMHDKAKAHLYAYLDRIQVEGYLTVQDEAQLYEKFNAMIPLQKPHRIAKISSCYSRINKGKYRSIL